MYCCWIQFLSSVQICLSTGWLTAASSTAPSCITKRAACWTSAMRTMPTWSTLLVFWARWLSCLGTSCPLCSWTKLDAWGCWVSAKVWEVCVLAVCVSNRCYLTFFSPAAGSSVISCVSCFFLSFGNSESAMIALLCLFGGISIASWNALDVLTVELYPSDKRYICCCLETDWTDLDHGS